MAKVKSHAVRGAVVKTNNKKATRSSPELEGVYILKIVLYLIIGSQWIRLTDAGNTRQIPLPVGLLVGVLFAAHDHFRIDRKIEFAILVLACFIGFWSQVGVYISILK